MKEYNLFINYSKIINIKSKNKIVKMGNSHLNNEDHLRTSNNVCNNYIYSLRLEKQKYYEYRTKIAVRNNSSVGCFSFLCLNQSPRNQVSQ